MEFDLEQSWPGEWMRGFMELCVLRAISKGPTYGYSIAIDLEANGFGVVKGGTLYPLLGRLEKAEWVRTYWGAGEGGPGRKFYELTNTGRTRLAEMTKLWGKFSYIVSAYLTGPAQIVFPQEEYGETLISQTVPSEPSTIGGPK